MDPNTGEVAAPTEVETLRAKNVELQLELRRIATSRATRSETQGKLALALSKAQGAMETASKDAKNPFYDSKYADLASVWGAIRKPLSENELAIFHTVLECNSKLVVVETRLHHSSDEWCSTVVSLPITAISKDRSEVKVITAQHIGAALTYGRRYGIQLVTGNAPKDDDDGNMISGKTAGPSVTREQYSQDEGPPTDDAPPSSPPVAATTTKAPAPAATPAGGDDHDKLEAEIPVANEAQHKAMVVRISALPESDRKVAIRKLWNARLKEIKEAKATPANTSTQLPPKAFAGESATDRAARGALDAITSKLNEKAAELEEKPAPVEVVNFPEPGSEG